MMCRTHWHRYSNLWLSGCVFVVSPLLQPKVARETREELVLLHLLTRRAYQNGQFRVAAYHKQVSLRRVPPSEHRLTFSRGCAWSVVIALGCLRASKVNGFSVVFSDVVRVVDWSSMEWKFGKCQNDLSFTRASACAVAIAAICLRAICAACAQMETGI